MGIICDTKEHGDAPLVLFILLLRVRPWIPCLVVQMHCKRTHKLILILVKTRRYISPSAGQAWDVHLD